MTPVTSRFEHGPLKRSKIYMKYELGISQRRIAFEEGVPLGSVSGIIRRYHKQKMPPVVQAEKRLKFGRMYKDEPESFWKRWILSDESTIARGDGEKQEWIFCPKVCFIDITISSSINKEQGQRLDIQYVQPKGKPSRHSQMFWGAISFSSRSSLWSLHGDPESARGGVTSRCILECLQDQLPKIARPGSIFAQDNAPTHKARIVQNWLREWAGQNGVTLVDWPPYSPDLNPIENIWKLLKEKICKRFPELSLLPKNNQSLNMLRDAAVEVWEDFHQDLINKLVLSIPRRLQAVVDANGWYTKY